MKEVANFFWERWKRACQMDAANKVLGKETPYIREAAEWTDAYKATLSKSKKSQFEKEWDKLNENLEAWHNASPKQLKNMPTPVGIKK